MGTRLGIGMICLGTVGGGVVRLLPDMPGAVRRRTRLTLNGLAAVGESVRLIRMEEPQATEGRR